VSSNLSRILGGAVALLVSTAAQGQLPFPPPNASGPTGAARQPNYPYPGQCVVDQNDLSWGVPLCTLASAPSFACEPVAGSTFANQTAGGWRACGAATPPLFKVLNPALPDSLPPAGTPATPKFVWEVINPPDYTPDTTTFPGADYYEIGVHEAWGFQALASAVPGPVGVGLFPDPLKVNPAGVPVPNGMQWTGLVCNRPLGCTCPAELAAAFAARYCPAGVIPPGAPLYTPIWGVGQRNTPATAPLAGVLKLTPPATSPEWSRNDYVATWPSISIRGTKGRPVVVRWVNEFPNNHLFCPHPEAADWPCAIDRTFMGVKARIDPATTPTGFAYDPFLNTGTLTPDRVNQFGSPQQPDNSWVTHLHGGEIPPSTDGFAEKWFGNMRTGRFYAKTPWLLSPAFEAPAIGPLFRPGGDPGTLASTAMHSWMNDTYTYPMVNDEATIWFHDHTLGKTHHNVIAGPAGFFPVKDPMRHGSVTGGVCDAVNRNGPAGAACTSTWLDPLTEPRDALTIPRYDLFLAIQDRAFNDDGSINFSNGLGQPVPAAPPPPIGATPVTPGVNPQVHPTWIPEYFGDHVLVNGVAWPKKTAEAGWYRLRLVDGSDSRCWTIGFSTTQPAVGGQPKPNVPFTVIADDQGYLPLPVQNQASLTMCPGERYELLVNFGQLPGLLPGAAATVFMTNSAPAPFPAGITPFAPASPFAEMNVVMRFDVQARTAQAPGVPTCGAAGLTWPTVPATIGCVAIPTAADPAFVDYKALPLCPPGIIATPQNPCISAVRQLYLNERADGVTLAPLGMQINGVPFEYKVTETPRQGTIELWKIVNLTVDAHPMHPHLVKHQVVETQRFSVGAYKAALCGSTTCQPGTSPGLEMQVVPDVTPFLLGTPAPTAPNAVNGGWKDASIALPGNVTTLVARWDAGWTVGNAALRPAPGAPGGPTIGALATDCPGAGPAVCSPPWNFEPVTSGPYVWHCHINSHEDSEMMRTSLVVP
jgi:FtsP/CotA-like multicopper oxidase with cupredoxin domain